MQLNAGKWRAVLGQELCASLTLAWRATEVTWATVNHKPNRRQLCCHGEGMPHTGMYHRQLSSLRVYSQRIFAICYGSAVGWRAVSELHHGSFHSSWKGCRPAGESPRESVRWFPGLSPRKCALWQKAKRSRGWLYLTYSGIGFSVTSTTGLAVCPGGCTLVISINILTFHINEIDYHVP